MKSFYIEVCLIPGAHLFTAINEAIELANRMNAIVQFEFEPSNGMKSAMYIMHPGDSIDDVFDRFERIVQHRREK